MSCCTMGLRRTIKAIVPTVHSRVSVGMLRTKRYPEVFKCDHDGELLFSGL